MALRYTLRGVRAVRAASAAAPIDDWQNFKMPSEPYAGMGPLPPAPKEVNYKGMTRMAFFSEGYFKFMEERLGYTGGYTLLFGSWVFLMSKEILVLNPETYWTFMAAPLMGAILTQGVIPFMDREAKMQQDIREENINSWKGYKMSLAESEVDGLARLKEQTEGLAMVQEQRKTNLAMALDAEYMNRQADLAAAVKKRLDFQVAMKNAEREAQSKHMIDWIDAEVKAAIAKRSAKDDLAAAIAQLKSMAK